MKNPIKWERGENVVKLFPTLVVDNFLSDPDYVCLLYTSDAADE